MFRPNEVLGLFSILQYEIKNKPRTPFRRKTSYYITLGFPDHVLCFLILHYCKTIHFNLPRLSYINFTVNTNSLSRQQIIKCSAILTATIAFWLEENVKILLIQFCWLRFFFVNKIYLKFCILSIQNTSIHLKLLSKTKILMFMVLVASARNIYKLILLFQFLLKNAFWKNSNETVKQLVQSCCFSWDLALLMSSNQSLSYVPHFF